MINLIEWANIREKNSWKYLLSWIHYKFFSFWLPRAKTFYNSLFIDKIVT